MDPLRQRLHVTDIGPFHHDHARIIAQYPCQLTVSDVDGIDTLGPALQEHIGEATGRGADVHRGYALDVYIEGIKSTFQLQSASADVWQRLGHQGDHHVGMHRRPGLGHDDAVHADPTTQDDGLSPSPTFSQFALHDQSIQSSSRLPFGHWLISGVTGRAEGLGHVVRKKFDRFDAGRGAKHSLSSLGERFRRTGYE
jgi:hypothetical protein